MSDPILIALIVACSAVFVAAIPAVLQYRALKQVAETGVKTIAKLDQVHTLVNSNLTEAQSRELDSMRGMLAAMREVIELREDRGMGITPETTDAIVVVEKRISELARDISHKRIQTDIADAQLARDDRT